MIERIGVLDHGFVHLVETWGSDERIVEAARMSTGKGFLGWGPKPIDESCRKCAGTGITDDRGCAIGDQPYFCTITCEACGGDKKSRVAGDEKLLRYLWEHKHATPFEMAGLVIEVQAPIFVFREWHRHRTQSYNEMSARYAPLPDVNYLATVDRALIGGGHLTKQAGSIAGAEALTRDAANDLLLEEADLLVMIEDLYQRKLRAGFPKELARTHLNISRYSRMRASANLRNWLAFLTLRMDPAAQWEIREYANAVGTIIAEKFPRTWSLFSEAR